MLTLTRGVGSKTFHEETLQSSSRNNYYPDLCVSHYGKLARDYLEIFLAYAYRNYFKTVLVQKAELTESLSTGAVK